MILQKRKWNVWWRNDATNSYRLASSGVGLYLQKKDIAVKESDSKFERGTSQCVIGV